MLSREENELLTRVGPGTPMGDLLRHYWIPACLSQDIPEPDCDPIRVHLLGEDLVAFRDTAGRAGLVAENCAHRGASLVLGRNEEGGLRCLYHGWKYDVDGRVLDTPCEPPGSSFKDHIRHVAYPTHEQGEVIWAYLGQASRRAQGADGTNQQLDAVGPGNGLPPFPNFEWTLAPSANRNVVKVLQDSNYLQGIEGALDSAHVDMLHMGHAVMGTWDQDTFQRPSRDVSPILEVADTRYGFQYAAIRKHKDEPDRLKYVRVTLFAMPGHCLMAGGVVVQIFIPADDEHCWYYDVSVNRAGAIDRERQRRQRRHVVGVDMEADGRRIPNRGNGFLQDRAAMREKKSFAGIEGGPNRDMAMEESMGPILDRTHEHLAYSDLGVVHLREVLARSLRDCAEGNALLGRDPDLDFERLRGLEEVMAIEASWREALVGERR